MKALPRSMGPARWAAVASGAAMLAACGTAPPAPVMTGPPDDQSPIVSTPLVPAGDHTYEQRLRERASAQAAQGKLADAAVLWEILTVLRPASSEYRERLAEARRRIAEVVPEQLQRAEQAQKRGELDAAVAQYLGVLALQPENAKAGDALRAIERDRNRRSYLAKAAGVTLAQRAEPAPPPAPRGNGRVPALDRNDFEHAAMLAAAGELDDAIALLERHMAAYRDDTGACQLLVAIYSRKAERESAKSRPGIKTQEMGARPECSIRR